MKITVFTIFFVVVIAAATASGQTTEFTYQGQLQNSSMPATGVFDFEFALFDTALGGAQIGSTAARNGVSVTAGIFSVNLDFGSSFPGGNRFLEIRVKQSGGVSFTTLSPRQPVSSSPYSIKSLNADLAQTATTANTATNATNAVNATTAATAASFTGPLAGDVTGTQSATTVARLQGRNVAAVQPNNGQVLKYNTTSSQWEPATDEAGSGGGNGTITGVTAGIGLTGGGTTGTVIVNIANGGVNTAQLADGSVIDSKIVSVSGAKVTGTVANATNAAQLGGVAAAQFVQTGDPRLSDTREPTAGSSNYIQNTASTQASSNFSISGTGTANVFNSTAGYNILGAKVLSIPGTGNAFLGVDSGAANSTGSGNAFFGNESGRSNTNGSSNSFFGRSSGQSNIDGIRNSFFGTQSGFSNVSGDDNTLMGMAAGVSNISGSNNSFFGKSAGQVNEAGSNNSFFGTSAGFISSGGSNSFFGSGSGSGTTTGNNNSFFGTSAGISNTTGSSNTLVGDSSNVGANNLTFATAIGSGAVVNSSNTVTLGRNFDTVQIPGNLNVAGTLTANINGASITNLNASNIATGTLNNARLGIVPVANGGTGSSTQNFVDLTTAQSIGGNKTFSGTLSGNIINATTQYNIGGSRVLSTAGTDNLFVGINAGAANTGDGNSFFGTGSGANTSNSNFNSFFGRNSGLSNTSGFNNSFFGTNSGDANLGGFENSFFGASSGGMNTSGDFNSFFGRSSGLTNTIGNNNTMLGHSADVGSGGLSFATAIGAGSIASQSNSVFLGRPGGEDAVRIAGALSLSGNLVVASGNLVQFGSPVVISTGALGTSGGTALCRNGLIQIALCSSSLRYKTNIDKFTGGLRLINQLRPITFDWKDGQPRDLGLGAEDVAAVDPLLVVYNHNGQVEGVKYDRIGVVLVNAVKEQQAEITAQKASIADLNSKIEDQSSKIRDQAQLIAEFKAALCSLKADLAVCKPNK